MRIAIFGAGGVGAVYGAKLARAGNDVVFIARGAHLAALRRSGLRVSGQGEEIHLAEVQASERPGDFAPVELVLFCVKLYDTETAARAMAPLVGPETLVLTLQNGVDGRERIGAVVAADRVLAGATYIGAQIAEAGHIRRTNPSDRLVFGERDGSRSERTREIASVLAEAGIEVEVSATSTGRCGPSSSCWPATRACRRFRADTSAISTPTPNSGAWRATPWRRSSRWPGPRAFALTTTWSRP